MMQTMTLLRCLVGICALWLAGCAQQPHRPQVVDSGMPMALVFTPQDQMRWEPVHFPGKLKTAFNLDRVAGRDGVRARAQSSASMLRQKLRLEPRQLGCLGFEWKVPGLIAQADLTDRDHEDSPVRLVLAFEGDRSRFSARNAMLNELARAVTGEEMPYATLMYVWSNHLPVGTVVTNPRTDRIRKIVVDSGSTHLGQWREHRRNLRADFEQAFGEPAQALTALAIMSDSDNTRAEAQAWYGVIRLRCD